MNYKELVQLLRTILANVSLTKDLLNQNFQDAILFDGEDSETIIRTEGLPDTKLASPEGIGPSIGLADGGVHAYDEFLEHLKLDTVISQSVGNQPVKKAIEVLIRKYYERSDIADEELKTSIKSEIQRLRSTVNVWKAIVPIDFLIFEDLSEFQIGNVKLKPAGNIAGYLSDQISHRIQRSQTPEADKQSLGIVMGSTVSKEFDQTRAYAEVNVVAEASRLPFLAEEEIETALNLLRCYTNVFFDRTLRTNMGLRHETGYRLRPTFGLSRDNESWTFNTTNIGLSNEYKLSASRARIMTEALAFTELSSIIGKPQTARTQLEKLLVTAIRWFGRGVVAGDNANKVLHYAAASENLIMGGQNEGEISEKYSDRVAFLVGKSGEERLKLYIRAKDLYNKRSKVIHTGITNIDAEDVAEMENLTLRCIVEIAKRSAEWSTHADFVGWVRREKYGAEQG